MAYQVLARKWRPQTFGEVVGQEHISRTLRNAIVQNRIGHAYLFVGSRGIGKTTSARIFAKALNCAHNIDGEPCCQCQSCKEVAAGTSMDVIEIDGASHNKVEHIRDIRENVQYTPVHGKYKIYIIDEVHMLTPQAWNALLKTLEEPPEHVKFLFATTEPHKVLPTIISRCQRFDLKRISVPLIVQRLRQIADGEHIHVEDKALAAIARAADGGMRDAQSIFDQMIAFCGGLADNELITEQDVIDVFGLASGMELREMAAALFTNDINRAMVVLQALADSGRDLERLFGDLINYVRNIMVAGICTEPGKFLEVSDSELQDLVNIGRALDSQLVQRVLQGLVAQEWSFRAAVNKRIYFETVLARIMLEAHSVQLEDIIARLNLLNGTLPQDQIPARPIVNIPPPVIQMERALRTEQTIQTVQAEQTIQTVQAEQTLRTEQTVQKNSADSDAPAAVSAALPESSASVAANVQQEPVAEPAPAVSASMKPVMQPASDIEASVVGYTSGGDVAKASSPATPVSAATPGPTAMDTNPAPAVSASALELKTMEPEPETAEECLVAEPLPPPPLPDTTEYNDDITPEMETTVTGMEYVQPVREVSANVAVNTQVEAEAEAGHEDLREPRPEEMQKLHEHPFVKKINDMFSTDIIFARIKNKHE